jgi:hypothetical protein
MSKVINGKKLFSQIEENFKRDFVFHTINQIQIGYAFSVLQGHIELFLYEDGLFFYKYPDHEHKSYSITRYLKDTVHKIAKELFNKSVYDLNLKQTKILVDKIVDL